MKKTSKKILALLLAAVLLVGALAGCGGNSDSNNPGNSSSGGGEVEGGRDVGGLKLPLTAEKQELTVWVVYSGTVVSDLNEIEGIKKIEEATNVHINWVPVEQQQVSERYGILLASDELPDIIALNMEYPGGFDKGMSDGVIHPDMDKLIRENMPNYMALLASNEEGRREATTDDGRLIVARTIVGTDTTAESEGNYQGLAYRADILQDLGLDVPTTVGEWHDALAAAKADGISAPFTLDTTGGSYMSLAWGISMEAVNTSIPLQLDGDKVVCGYALDGFKGYLDTMRQWYSEGLINKNFTSFNYYLDTPGSVDVNEGLLYSRVLSAFAGDNYVQFHMVTNPDVYLQAVPAPVLNAGDEVLQSCIYTVAKEGMYITADCKNPELAAKWMDYMYTEEAEYLNWYGIEGVTYEIGDDGTPYFTDFVLNNPDGTPGREVLQKYALCWGESWVGKHDISANLKFSAATASGPDHQQEALEIWTEPSKNIAFPNGVTLTDAEADKIVSPATALTTMMQEYTVNYIIGESVKPFEDYVKDLYSFGLQDVVDVYQAAYDRYLAR